MAPNPEDRPSAEKVLASPLLARAQQQSQQAPPSTASTQSAVTTADAAATGSSKQFGGLVLQRSVPK